MHCSEKSTVYLYLSQLISIVQQEKMEEKFVVIVCPRKFDRKQEVKVQTSQR